MSRRKKNKKMNPAQLEAVRTKDFFDCILPGSVRFMSDYYIVGDSYRSVWVVREYPPSTEEQAILSQLADLCAQQGWRLIQYDCGGKPDVQEGQVADFLSNETADVAVLYAVGEQEAAAPRSRRCVSAAA